MDRANISIVAEHMMTDLGMSKVQFGFWVRYFRLAMHLPKFQAEYLQNGLVAGLSQPLAFTFGPHSQY